jgi:hypothetical protein
MLFHRGELVDFGRCALVLLGGTGRKEPVDLGLILGHRSPGHMQPRLAQDERPFFFDLFQLGS